MQNLLCFSHLSWNFVFQRPQHLLTRFSKSYQVFYFEEPKIGDSDRYIVNFQNGVYIVELLITEHDETTSGRIQNLIHEVLREYNIESYISWYYTPMALQFTSELTPETVIYDSMDELSAFRFAPPQLLQFEEELFKKADVVFTGGNSLYQAKKTRHHNIHAMPSSIDKEHFGLARGILQDPEDQMGIGFPRMGFFGVVDERFDIELLREVSAKRPDWQFVIIGPVVKINPDDLPRASNIHYLGPKTYTELPQYIAHWDIALILFALNESTEFISPTKTPEYLAAGKPVISTAIKDVVQPYGIACLVQIIDDSDSFISAAEKILSDTEKDLWLRNVDHFLENDSWDYTFYKMNVLINEAKSNLVHLTNTQKQAKYV
ncbi:Putative teichuronic acid biosynthesis glycosyltransferase TuaH [Chryseobacterium aquaeductus]|uniref:Teichuronic acid biosynthesis glycosyltransferase TuaH n=1 Tax=Chryseobacterium aquaeductus TaxID=2675056 RepID=A0A9N8MHJ2_9FLAO|nr:glycosyltransferase family 1 protein [Chryseobacterium aquaeductus]CAA7331891.1 Putative teichuronic acid biosynthesis glycosyltransferase TuaH [Chryseobacterium potabilaquae]CAD7813101.1 Putative teichuronic acid biosynthesis glycosyltransferase TuaH [Chryseobacterium aquaeductus]